ncbi:MAG: GAF domain-containing protein, partial [Nitrospinae bacterium]|nr:GAF domain-containing protein [Nitrospinota bacterium]
MDIKDTQTNTESAQPRRFSNDENLNILLNSVVDEVSVYAERLGGQIKKLSDIGRALSGVYDLNTLLEMIVDQARNFTNADAGTLYIVEDNTLRFQIVQNDSLKIRMGGKTGETIPFPPVELKESNVSAFVALKGVSVNIPDVYDTDLFDFTGPKKFDNSTGYRSQSMLVVPMRNHDNDVIGVLQLLNATNPDTKKVISFSQDYENLCESLASQAAVSITNAKLISNMTELFEAFVKVMATAIDEKSPVTGGHIRRVADLTLTLADVIHNSNEGKFKDISFTPDQFYELRIAAYMHDIGKVTTPVEIVEKAKKLQTIFDRIHYVRLRMDYISQKISIEGQNSKIELLQNGGDPEKLKALEAETQNKVAEIQEIRDFINKCNEPGEFLDDETLERLKEISQKTFIDNEGEQQPYLTEDELLNLSIRRGSITEAERKKMQDHAAVTLRMLKQIPFTKKLKNIPDFAGAHHEFINGKGYPLGLKG